MRVRTLARHNPGASVSPMRNSPPTLDAVQNRRRDRAHNAAVELRQNLINVVAALPDVPSQRQRCAAPGSLIRGCRCHKGQKHVDPLGQIKPAAPVRRRLDRKATVRPSPRSGCPLGLPAWRRAVRNRASVCSEWRGHRPTTSRSAAVETSGVSSSMFVYFPEPSN